MNATNEEKSTLEARESALDMWMYGGMVAVLAGVIIEIVPDFVSSHSWLVSVSHRVGGSMLALGLLDEFVVDIKVRKCRARLKEIADIEFGEVLTRATQAEEAAAEANLARVRIEAKLASRKLNKAARAELVELLKPYAGKHVDIVLFDHHNMEVDLFGASIQEVFQAAGWTSRVLIPSGSRIPGRAVTITFAKDARADERAELYSIADSFASVLTKCGICPTVFIEGFTMSEEILFENAASFRIQVGQINVVEDPL